MTALAQPLARIFEAILLAAAEPVPITRLCELLAPERKLFTDLLEESRAHITAQDRI